MAVVDRTGIDAFVGKQITLAAVGAVAGAIAGIGAAPGAIFLTSVGAVGTAIEWMGRKVLRIRQDTAPFTLSIVSTALSILAAMKIVSLAGYNITAGAALVLGAGVPAVTAALILGAGALAIVVSIGALFKSTVRS